MSFANFIDIMVKQGKYYSSAKTIADTMLSLNYSNEDVTKILQESPYTQEFKNQILYWFNFEGCNIIRHQFFNRCNTGTNRSKERCKDDCTIWKNTKIDEQCKNNIINICQKRCEQSVACSQWADEFRNICATNCK